MSARWLPLLLASTGIACSCPPATQCPNEGGSIDVFDAKGKPIDAFQVTLSNTFRGSDVTMTCPTSDSTTEYVCMGNKLYVDAEDYSAYMTVTGQTPDGQLVGSASGADIEQQAAGGRCRGCPSLFLNLTLRPAS